MSDASAMSPVEGTRHLGPDLQELIERQRPLGQPLGEALALEVLHDQEADAVLLAHVEERTDVGVAESRDRLGLALEALKALRVLGQVAGEHLDRDRTVEPRVLGAVHLAHPPRAERRFDLVGPEALTGLQAHRRPSPVPAGEAVALVHGAVTHLSWNDPAAYTR